MVESNITQREEASQGRFAHRRRECCAWWPKSRVHRFPAPCTGRIVAECGRRLEIVRAPARCGKPRRWQTRGERRHQCCPHKALMAYTCVVWTACFTRAWLETRVSIPPRQTEFSVLTPPSDTRRRHWESALERFFQAATGSPRPIFQGAMS